MIVLLDENFPLGLLRSLQTERVAAQHIITLGWRGASDSRIRERLQDDQVLFLTQDEDFLFGEKALARRDLPPPSPSLEARVLPPSRRQIDAVTKGWIRERRCNKLLSRRVQEEHQ